MRDTVGKLTGNLHPVTIGVNPLENRLLVESRGGRAPHIARLTSGGKTYTIDFAVNPALTFSTFAGFYR